MKNIEKYKGNFQGTNMQVGAKKSELVTEALEHYKNSHQGTFTLGVGKNNIPDHLLGSLCCSFQYFTLSMQMVSFINHRIISPLIDYSNEYVLKTNFSKYYFSHTLKFKTVYS